MVVLTSFAKIVYTKKNHAGGMKTILPGRVKYSFIVSTIKFDKQIGNYDVGYGKLFVILILCNKIRRDLFFVLIFGSFK